MRIMHPPVQSAIRNPQSQRLAPPRAASQKTVFATPRAIAVSDSASQIPNRPSVPDHHAASEMRSAVKHVPTSIGHRVYPAPTSAPSSTISNVWPICAKAMIRK